MSAIATQTSEVLQLLHERPAGVTAMEALTEIGCFRLAARIADLKAQGHRIISEMISVRARNGRFAHIARYRLESP